MKRGKKNTSPSRNETKAEFKNCSKDSEPPSKRSGGNCPTGGYTLPVGKPKKIASGAKAKTRSCRKGGTGKNLKNMGLKP